MTRRAREVLRVERVFKVESTPLLYILAPIVAALEHDMAVCWICTPHTAVTLPKDGGGRRRKLNK